jgi:glycosyltransferase involved in cell wall biosynthesis
VVAYDSFDVNRAVRLEESTSGTRPNSTASSKRRVALLTNIVAPYRIPVYERLGRDCELLILYGVEAGEEPNRGCWAKVECQLSNARMKRSRGFVLDLRRRQGGRVFDRRYVHITPGFLLDLVRFRPHVVISNEMGFRTLIALLYGSFGRVPVWVWWGGTVYTERNIGWPRRLLRALIRRWARNWISYGETSTEYLLSIGVLRARILQVQNCVDERLHHSTVIPLLEIEPRPVLLYVGQLIARKGVAALLGSAARLRRTGHVFSLVLVGDGPEKQRLQSMVSDLGLEGVVHFRSSVSPDEMPRVYRSADAMIFPTLEDVWGLVVNEALLCGLPVLCSRYAGCAPELLPPENVFDPLDSREFDSALERAVLRRIAPPDLARLWSCNNVGEAILRAILGRTVEPVPAAAAANYEIM